MNNEQRTTINLLAGNMMKANNTTPYDATGYDSNQSALYAFLRSILGDDTFNAIDRTNVNWNWGGNNSYADDVIAAIEYHVESVETTMTLQQIKHSIDNQDCQRLSVLCDEDTYIVLNAPKRTAITFEPFGVPVTRIYTCEATVTNVVLALLDNQMVFTVQFV